MNSTRVFSIVLASLATPAIAQNTVPVSAVAAQPVPMVVAPVSAGPSYVLPANTVVTLAMNDTISTKGNHWNEGDNFDMTVTQDVRLGQYVIIPRGSHGAGRISWLTNKGAFGKSGKMEIDIEYVEVGGRRIPLSGHYRQEGEGNTVGTVAGVVAVGVFAGFVTGKSGVIPQGRELTAHTKEDLPIVIAGPAPMQNVPMVMQPAAAPVAVARAPEPPAAAPATPPTPRRDHIRCVTCR